MNECFFCGPTQYPLTEEHIWPRWISKLLQGKYGSDHFVHIRSTGDNTNGLWKSAELKVTIDTLCSKCNNDWLSTFENDVIRPIATPLILGKASILRPLDQWSLAAWAYKMAMLLEQAVPENPRRFFTSADRKQFRETTLAHQCVRIFLAQYDYGHHPAHAHLPLHTLTRREDGVSFDLKVSTVTAGCLAMQVMAVRSVDTGELVSATNEVGFEFLGKAKEAIRPIWPPVDAGIRWPMAARLNQQDIEDLTDMWHKAEGIYTAAT